MKEISDIEKMFKKQHEDYMDDLDENGIECPIHKEKYLPDEDCRTCAEEKEAATKLAAMRWHRGIPIRYHNMTLDTYKAESEGQKKAMAAIKRLYAGDVNSLILSGSCGTGKTHLAVALQNVWLRDASFTTFYITASELVRSVKDTWGGKGSEQQEINRWANYDYLVVDEMGASFGSDTEQLLISEILCKRYHNGKRTVLISNLNMDELKDTFDARVLSRLREDAVLVVFDWEDERKSL